MIALVRIALLRPLTFIVMAILILLAGMIAAFRTPVDIFPDIRIPVIAVIWQYEGLPPDQMSGRIVTGYERILTTTVNNIEHIESQSMSGRGIVKIYFQPGTDIRIATAQVTSISQTYVRFLPPGGQPPFILNYNASTVPIIQLALKGNGISEAQLFDLSQNQVRPALSTVPGLALPWPSGGAQRQIQVDLDPHMLQQTGLSAQDVSDALAAQNQVNPVGFIKIGTNQYNVQLNNAVNSVEALNAIPIKVINGVTVTMRDVAHVRDGSVPQTNVVHVENQRSILLTVLKNGAISTLSIIDNLKRRLPKIIPTLPPGTKILPLADQSLFVKAAVQGVVREGVIAALLTALMILLFLGSWRSTLIVIVSIPLSVLAAIAALAAFGETLNVMTLGGLALAVGILVDEATVTIESINYHLEQGKPVLTAIMDGATQIVTPAFVSLLSICIVFVPMFVLPGVAGYLFVPMALSVIFAMVASFILSRTLVPTMARYLLQAHAPGDAMQGQTHVFARIHRGFESGFERFKRGHLAFLHEAMRVRSAFLVLFMVMGAASFLLVPFLGRTFFPSVDAGQILLHVRAPIGTRIEATSDEFAHIEARIRTLIPHHDLVAVADNIGLPNSGINNVYTNDGTIGPQDGDILISLAPGHAASQAYIDTMNHDLPLHFAGDNFAFLPADITSQILNFGVPAPLDIKVSGRDLNKDAEIATALV
ncbi:MAG: efflux RND transporter permease subunit, partial [Alphaproteobacteria bacterium]|nr:efflux RND transporter permease subunit [Alphaproteobacteria bacterium]